MSFSTLQIHRGRPHYPAASIWLMATTSIWLMPTQVFHLNLNLVSYCRGQPLIASSHSFLFCNIMFNIFIVPWLIDSFCWFIGSILRNYLSGYVSFVVLNVLVMSFQIILRYFPSYRCSVIYHCICNKFSPGPFILQNCSFEFCCSNLSWLKVILVNKL